MTVAADSNLSTPIQALHTRVDSLVHWLYGRLGRLGRLGPGNVLRYTKNTAARTSLGPNERISLC